MRANSKSYRRADPCVPTLLIQNRAAQIAPRRVGAGCLGLDWAGPIASGLRPCYVGILYYSNHMAKVSTGETIDGKPVTKEQIREWADDAEKGFNVDELRRRGRPRLGDGPSTVIPVRMDEDLLDALNKKAEQDGVSRSEAIREAVRSWTRIA